MNHKIICVNCETEIAVEGNQFYRLVGCRVVEGVYIEFSKHEDCRKGIL